MDKRSGLSDVESLDYTDTPDLESDTNYRGMSVATDYSGDSTATFDGEYEDGGTITADDNEPDLTEQRMRVERTRAQMGSTINEIEQRLSPGHLADQAKSAVREATVGRVENMANDISNTATDVGGSFIDTVRGNPIPAALVGVGLGWLFMSMRKSGHTHHHHADQYRYYGHDMYDTRGNYNYRSDRGGYETSGYSSYGVGGSQGQGQGIGGRVSNMAGGVTDTASNIAGSATDTARGAMGTAQNAAGQVAGTVTDTAGQVAGTVQNAAGAAADTLGQVGQQAQYGFSRAESQFERWMREQPLAVAVGAFAAGIVAGVAIPETPIENQWMGDYRNQLVEKVSDVADQAGQKAGTVAQEAVSAAKDAAQQSAQEQGLPIPGSDNGSSGDITEVEFTPSSESSSI